MISPTLRVHAVLRGEWPWQSGEYERELDFETVEELERFLSYNRAYFVRLSFSGTLEEVDE